MNKILHFFYCTIPLVVPLLSNAQSNSISRCYSSPVDTAFVTSIHQYPIKVIYPLKHYTQEAFTHHVCFGAPIGTPVYAMSNGIVTQSSCQRKGDGNQIEIMHDDGLESFYAHLDTIEVNVGDTVFCNQRIGTVGNSGQAAGPHLDFTLYKDGTATSYPEFIKSHSENER